MKLNACIVYGVGSVGKTSLVNAVNADTYNHSAYDTDEFRNLIFLRTKIEADRKQQSKDFDATRMFHMLMHEKVADVISRHTDGTGILFSGVDLKAQYVSTLGEQIRERQELMFYEPVRKRKVHIREFLMAVLDEARHWDIYKKAEWEQPTKEISAHFQKTRNEQDELLRFAKDSNIPILSWDNDSRAKTKATIDSALGCLKN
jgi:2-phosphoglycerate kinase